jgi:surface antigen
LHALLRLTAMIGAFAVGGCSYQLGSVTPKSAADVEQTGALGRPAQQAEAAAPPETDLAYARAVAAEALARNGKGESVPWSNPNTGASGNITPLATSYGEGTCRDFLASYVRGETEAWLQGEACRTGRGKWEVKSLTPLNRS